MLPEFSERFFQLALISTTITYVRNRYMQEKRTSILAIRFLLSIIKQPLIFILEKILAPLFNPFYTYVNKLDKYLCTHIDTIRYICPIVDRNFDEVFSNYGDLFSVSFLHKKPVESNSNSTDVKNIDERKKFNFIQPFSQFLTSVLITVEMYSKFVRSEVHDHINASQTLWKNLNMADGRSLEEVDSTSEKLLIIGRRMCGNCHRLIYLIRYQWKRCRSILCSFLRFQYRLRSLFWHTIRKTKINQSNNLSYEDTQHGLTSPNGRIQHIFDVMMAYAARHPWVKWRKSRPNPPAQLKFENSTKCIRPMFFLSSTNNSDCSESDDNIRAQCVRNFQSTPYRKSTVYSNINQPIVSHEDALSDICSSLSSTPDNSFDMNDILRQNETDNHDEQAQQSTSIFDLSPVFASGGAV